MLAKDILVSFLEYNYWADEQILRQIERLAAEQLHDPAEVSHETAFNLVRHMLDVEWSWRLFASGGAGQQYLWEVEDIPDLPAIRRFWSAERDRMLDYVRSLSEEELDQAVDYGTAQGGAPRYAKRWEILLHVVNHSTHHRSELSRSIQASGQAPTEQAPDLASFITWAGVRE